VGAPQCLVNYGEDAFQILIDVVIPETQYSEPIRRECLIAIRITPGMSVEVMLPAVDFDDETVLEADKVNDITIARRLPSKMKTTVSPFTQMDPQFHFLRGHLLAQTTRDLVCHDPHPARCARHPPPKGEG
jgi:hypothetical protein